MDERASWLQTACGGDEALRTEVESLLRYYRPDTVTDVERGDGRDRRIERQRWSLSASARRSLSIRALLLAVLLTLAGFVTHGLVLTRIENRVGERLLVTLDRKVTALTAWLDG